MATIDFNTVRSNISLSEDRVQQLSERAAETAAAFARKLEKIQETFSKARDQYSRDAEELVQSADSDNRVAAQRLAKAQAGTKISQLRRNLISSSESERSEMLKALKAYSDEAEQIVEISKTPAMLLGRVALGETKRTNYIQQLEGAGPVELETAARLAVMSGDMVLASAIAAVIDRRHKDRRPFTVTAFAERMVGQTWERINRKLEGIRLAFKSSIAADREFVRGKADPLMNLSLALSRRAIAEAQAEEV